MKLFEQLYRVNAEAGRHVPGTGPATRSGQDMFPCMRRAPRPADPPARPGRRVLLGGALGLAAAVLTGCRVRWEDSAPEIPFIPIPTREPIPAEDALLWLLRDSHDLATTAEAADDPDHAVYAEQAAVLRTALYRAGVPIETIEEALAAPIARPPAPTVTAPPFTAVPLPDPTESTESTQPMLSDGASEATDAPVEAPEPTSPPEPSPPQVAPRDGPAAALRRLRDLAGCGAGLFPIVVSLLAQRWAAVHEDGYEVPGVSVTSRAAAAWPSPERAIAFAALTDPARYGFEVVAAQSREEARLRATTTLAQIHALLRTQDARSAGTADAPGISYPLPFAVGSEETAAALATEILTDLVEGYAVLIGDLAGVEQHSTMPDVVAWLGTAAALGARWGVPLTAFPGLTTGTPTTLPMKTPAPTGAPTSPEAPRSTASGEPTASP